MRISDWSSDVCSSDLLGMEGDHIGPGVGKCLQPGIDRRHHQMHIEWLGAVRPPRLDHHWPDGEIGHDMRSEEHKSELQSLMRNSYAVVCLKKKVTAKITTQYTQDNIINRLHMK